jgi:hypothetical protein
MQLCCEVGLGIEKSLQAGLFHFLYFKEFYPEPMFQNPLNFGS